MFRYASIFTVLVALIWTDRVSADFSVFVSRVGFDGKTDIESDLGAGIRWGKSSRILGGETSLMVSRPEKAGQNMTALFWEGRFLLNVPTGTKIRPVASIGFGNLLLTSVDIEDLKKFEKIQGGEEAIEEAAVNEALSRIEGNSSTFELQNNRIISIGGGVRYALSNKLAFRMDYRRYFALSFKDFAKDAVKGAVKEEIDKRLPPEFGDLTKDQQDAILDEIVDSVDDAATAGAEDESTVQHNEISLGILITF